MEKIKPCLKHIIAFLLTLVILTSALVLSAMIPKTKIQSNVLESAEYLCEGELFGTILNGKESSKIDRYADSILLAIAYQYDENHPLESVMWSSYYFTKYQNENKNLLDAVTEDQDANQQYLRYWHGSISLVRPLLLFFNIEEIYLLHGVILAVLIILLFLTLFRKRAFAPMIGLLCGLILTSTWYVPLSLEYTWVYLLTMLFSIIGLKMVYAGKRGYLGFFFLICGMLTNYMDFLTTETLTLSIPLLLILWVEYRQNFDKQKKMLLLDTGRRVVFWGIGYVGMWISKWILASLVLKVNVIPYVSGHIEERLGGNIGLSLTEYLFGSITKNISCLFPLEYGFGGRIFGWVLILFVIYVGFVYRKDSICKTKIGVYLFLALVPYIRFAVLHNHSYLHYFFTYRAQMATILAIVLILEELTDWRWLTHANVRR